jgi:DNA polymerase-3 subunit epsilon
MDLEEILRDRDLVVLDLETTGTSIKTDRVVQFAGVRIFADRRPRENLELLINPGIPIPPSATEVNHITDEMVRDAPRFEAVSDRIERFLADADLAGFNVLAYDIPLLRAELERCHKPFNLVGRRVVDGMTIFKHYERRDLAAAVKFYCGVDQPTAHQALADALATVQVIQAQLDRYDDIPRTLEGLDRLSRGRRITPDGRLVWQEGVPCIGFGAHQGVPLQTMVKEHRDYLSWILKSDFSEEVKDVVARALKGKFPEPE